MLVTSVSSVQMSDWKTCIPFDVSVPTVSLNQALYFIQEPIYDHTENSYNYYSALLNVHLSFNLNLIMFFKNIVKIKTGLEIG